MITNMKYKYLKYKKKYLDLKNNNIGGSCPYKKTLIDLWNMVIEKVTSISNLNDKIIFESIESILNKFGISIYYNDMVKLFNKNKSKFNTNEKAMFNIIQNHQDFKIYSKVRPLNRTILQDIIKQDSLIIKNAILETKKEKLISIELANLYKFFMIEFKKNRINMTIQDAIIDTSLKSINKFPKICNRIDILKKSTNKKEYINVLSHIEFVCRDEGGTSDIVKMLSQIPEVPSIQPFPKVPTGPINLKPKVVKLPEAIPVEAQ